MQAIGLQRVWRERSHVFNVPGCGQNEEATEERGEKRPQRVERLRQIEPARCGLRLTQHSYVRIGGYLKAGDPGSQYYKGA